MNVLLDISRVQASLLLFRTEYINSRGIISGTKYTYSELIKTINDALMYLSAVKRRLLVNLLLKGKINEIPFSDEYTTAIIMSDNFHNYDLEIVSKHLYDLIGNITVDSLINILSSYAITYHNSNDENVYMSTKRIAQVLYMITHGKIDIREQVY